MVILVAEDNSATQKVIEFVLKYGDNEVVIADDGKKAYELFKLSKPDLVVTDIEMPQINGIELIHRIRQSESSNIPILVLTSHGYPNLVRAAVKAGATSFLTKPFEARTLRDRVNNLLAGVN